METLVFVAGATGGTGRLVVKELRRRGLPVRMLVRRVAEAREKLGAGDYYEGDAVTSDLVPALAGVTHVICALGSREPGGLSRVDLPAVRRLSAAARGAGVKHFVLCSTIGAVPTPGVPDHLVQAFASKGEAEAELRQSGVSFTIIRPGRLVDEPDADPRSIERVRVAGALVEAAFCPEAAGGIYELSGARLARVGANPVFGFKADG